MKASEPQRAEVYIPEAVVNGLEADVLAVEDVADVDPVAVPADAAVAVDAADLEVGRILDRAADRGIRGSCDSSAGVFCPSASCGRSSLNSVRNALKRRCWAPRLPCGGRVVSALSVRCIRSCRPFCSG